MRQKVDKKIKTAVTEKKTEKNNTMKMTISPSSVTTHHHHQPQRGTRKVLRVAHKRPGTSGSRAFPTAPLADSSDDSGLGFDQHVRSQQTTATGQYQWTPPEMKRRKLAHLGSGIKVESEDANDDTAFRETVNGKEPTALIRATAQSVIPAIGRNSNPNTATVRGVPRCISLVNKRAPSGPVTLTSQLTNVSRNGKIQLQIICQPEQQHRARYQTEGSRGAVKDRTGNGFPIVKLIGYDKPATLQVYIGTDMGRVAPHMFYQACRVSGKNSTPCAEKKIEGTIVIELELEPSKDMMVTCDCVGILKERNVDVEHRFPDQSGPRSKKKSTRCRMVFRATITHDDGVIETLQTCSQPIVCTQPPGIPEISKKSLTVAPVNGNVELFILGKNFLKDSRVVFQQVQTDSATGEKEIFWEETVTPDKEYLQQTHLVCVVPPYVSQSILEPVTVNLYIVSSGKTSEPHPFTYTPSPPAANASSYSGRDEVRSIVVWRTKPELNNEVMMPPPVPLIPLSQRRPSTGGLLMSDGLKTEVLDENSLSSDASLSDNSVDGTHLVRHSGVPHVTNDTGQIAEKPILNDLNKNGCGSGVNGITMILPDQINMNDGVVNGIAPHHLSSGLICRSSRPEMPVIMNDNSVDASYGSTNMLNSVQRPTSFEQALIRNSEELQIVDLRVKATEADFIHTQTASIATFRQFDITETPNAPLPAQSGQSVENYLTAIENSKTTVTSSITPQIVDQKILTQGKFNIPIFSTQLDEQKVIVPNVDIDPQTQKNLSPDEKLNISIFNAHQEALENSNSNGAIHQLDQKNLSHIAMFNQQINNNLSVLKDTKTLQLTEPEPDQKILSPVEKLDFTLYNSQQQINPTFTTNNTDIQTSLNTLSNLIPSTREQMFGENLAVRQNINNNLLTNTGENMALLSNVYNNQTDIKTSTTLDLLSTNTSVIANNLATNAQVDAATAKLDALVNSAVDTHIGSPEMASSSLCMSPNDTSSPDILLNAQSNNPQLTVVSSPEATASEVILDPQVTQNNLLLATQTGNTLDTSCQNNASLSPCHVLSPTHKSPPVAVKNMILNAAVNILESQQPEALQSLLRCQPESTVTNASQIFNTSSSVCETFQVNAPTNYIDTTQFQSADVKPLIISEPVKEIVAQTQTDATKEGFVSQELTAMSETDLLSYINPSCFDQV